MTCPDYLESIFYQSTDRYITISMTKFPTSSSFILLMIHRRFSPQIKNLKPLSTASLGTTFPTAAFSPLSDGATELMAPSTNSPRSSLLLSLTRMMRKTVAETMAMNAVAEQTDIATTMLGRVSEQILFTFPGVRVFAVAVSHGFQQRRNKKKKETR